MKSVNQNQEEEKVRVLFDVQGSVMKEKFGVPLELINNPVNIQATDEVVLIGPDNGKCDERDEGFVPNVHNGIFRVHAYLHEHGINSSMVNSDVDNLGQAFELIKRHHPPFIGFSPYYDTLKKDFKNIDNILNLSPNSVIVAGGYEASLNSQWRGFGGLVDVLVRGEGEIPMLKLAQEYRRFSKINGNGFEKEKFLEFLRESSEIKKVPAVSILEPGKTAKPEYVERISNEFYSEISLNAFERHLNLSPIEKYWKLSRTMFDGRKDSYFRFITRDFCPYKCIFCESPTYFPEFTGEKSGVRIVESEDTLRIIKAVTQRYPQLDLMIDDDNFMVYPTKAKQTLEMIIEAKKNGEIRDDLQIQVRCRTDNVVNNPWFPALFKEAGGKMLSMGSESYSQHELDSMRKQTSPETNLKAVRMLLENGIAVAENYLIFTPGVTKDSFYENASAIVRNIRDFDVDGVVTPFLSPIPSTPLWGNGVFEKVPDFPYQHLYPDKVMFRNQKSGYEYIGEEIYVPRANITVPHPEVVLLRDPFMRDISMKFITYLPEAVDKLRKISPEAHLSRSFQSLCQLYAGSHLLYEHTKESRWHDLGNEIERVARIQGSSSTAEFSGWRTPKQMKDDFCY